MHLENLLESRNTAINNLDDARSQKLQAERKIKEHLIQNDMTTYLNINYAALNRKSKL